MNPRRIRGPTRPAGSANEARPPGAARPPAPTSAAASGGGHTDGSVRLSKRMSELGLASRREADEWIARGWVRVDGRVVSELGSRVVEGQRITIDAPAKQAQAQLVTVLVNKPVGFVSGQAEDGYQPARVLVTREKQWREDRSPIHFTPQHLRSLVPAGRLDIDSVGLLVLTQDGRIAKQLVGEGGEIEKEYLVRVASKTGAPLRAGQAGAAAPRPQPRRRAAAAGAGRVAQRRPAALRPHRKARSGRSAACARRSGCRCSA